MTGVPGKATHISIWSRLADMPALRWLSLFAWMALIYYFSDQPNSNDLTEHFFGDLNYYMRKLAHMSEYAILLLLSRAAFSAPSSRVLAGERKDYVEEAGECAAGSSAHNICRRPCQLTPLLLTIIYAISDEWHQSFVPGRSASAGDVAIDSAGACIALAAVTFFKRRTSAQTFRHK